MKSVLFIDCCIRREESRSKKLAEHFLANLEKEQGYTIESLCLMDEALTFFSDGFFSQREALLQNGVLQHPRFRYAHQFAKADKIVIAAPFWDLSFPALLKVYIENISVDGITFHADEKGLTGLCKADNMVYFTTRGGIYEGTDMEMGSVYLQAMSKFFGIEQYTCIAAEGLDLGIRPAEEILQEAMRKAEEIAKSF
ncbi:MAG: NAD(P)H-dependent oxidoreductase [Anaerotignum sp.]|nr:NAD(P)H-dependent oxidoreductase [Anaerotignum sp.]